VTSNLTSQYLNLQFEIRDSAVSIAPITNLAALKSIIILSRLSRPIQFTLQRREEKGVGKCRDRVASWCPLFTSSLFHEGLASTCVCNRSG
jgi:hypothetical protein